MRYMTLFVSFSIIKCYGILVALPLDSPWQALFCIILFAGTIATFVSHTVAALILLPIISKIGVDLGIPTVTVICSALASK